MNREHMDEALALLRELAAPAATAIEIDGPVCGICERDLTGEDEEAGHVRDCLVMRARAFVRRYDRRQARSEKGATS